MTPTPLVVAVVKSLADPDLSLRDIAKLHGCSVTHVQRISRAIGLTEALCEPDSSTEAPLEVETRARGSLRERDLSRAAWSEWKGGRSLRGELVAQPRPPRWFVSEELGFSICEGPSLLWTCKTLLRANDLAVRALGRDAPRRVTYPLNFDERRPSRGKKFKPAKTTARRRAATLAQLVERALSRAREGWESE